MSSSSDVPRLPRLGWLVAFVVLAALIAWAYVSVRQMHAHAPSGLEHYARAPEFQLTDQNGQLVSLADLKGKVWVADFIFTRCPGPCPIMTSHMAELNQALGSKANDVELVTITVDPEYDTPEVLKKYREHAGAMPVRWKFLTGPADKIREITIKGFLQPLSKDDVGTPMHSTRFILVDRDGWMRGFQDGSDPEVVQKLLVDIGSLLREPSSEGKTQ